MESDIDGGKLPIIPKEGSDPSSTTYVVNAANEIGTVLKPGDKNAEVVIDLDGMQTLSKEEVGDKNAEVVAVLDENEGKNKKTTEYYDPNDVSQVVLLDQFLSQDENGGGNLGIDFGGFDDDFF